MTAAGVCLIIKANLVFLAGEGLYAAVSQRFDADFGSCKTHGDIVLVSIAIISSWLALGGIIGVREGNYQRIAGRRSGEAAVAQIQHYSVCRQIMPASAIC